MLVHKRKVSKGGLLIWKPSPPSHVTKVKSGRERTAVVPFVRLVCSFDEAC